MQFKSNLVPYLVRIQNYTRYLALYLQLQSLPIHFILKTIETIYNQYNKFQEICLGSIFFNKKFWNMMEFKQ